MALIPKQDLLKDAVEGGPVLQENREYIGMSALGSACSRRIWYDFHWAYDRYVTKRIARIFERGDIEEARVVRDLQAVGVNTWNVLENQIELVDHTGHIRGHPDGACNNVPGAEKTDHALEIKTMNSKRYADYVKKGLKATNPSYWGQAHVYMGECGYSRMLFCVTNKDNEERHYERIHYDKQVHDECMSRGFDILTSEEAPKKIGERTWFECKMCDARGICHKGEPISKNCRTCKYFDIEMEGAFACSKHKTMLGVEKQKQGCSDYEISEVF